MEVAALVTWILTALGGAYMLSIWISKGGHKPDQGSRFPPVLIFGLAALGLLLWIVYVVTDNHTLAWIAFVALLVVAALGSGMLSRWLPTYRQASVPATPGADPAADSGPAETTLPSGGSRRPRPPGRRHPGARAALRSRSRGLNAARLTSNAGMPE